MRLIVSRKMSKVFRNGMVPGERGCDDECTPGYCTGQPLGVANRENE